MKSKQIIMHDLTSLNAFKLKSSLLLLTIIRLTSAIDPFLQIIYHRIYLLMQVNFLFNFIFIGLIDGSKSIIELLSLTFIKTPLNKYAATAIAFNKKINKNLTINATWMQQINRNKIHFIKLINETNDAFDKKFDKIYWIKLCQRHQTSQILRYQCNSNNNSNSNKSSISYKFSKRINQQTTLLKLFGFLMLFTSVVALPPVVRIGK